MAARDRPLIIGEGVENAVPWAARLGYAAIAAMSAANLAKLEPPPCSKLIILADRDRSDTGQRAAQELAERISRAHGSVVIVPPPDGFDWNEVAQARDCERYLSARVLGALRAF